MEETLVTAAVDLSGRAWFVYDVVIPTPKIGEFDSQLVEVFWQAVAANGLMNLHFLLHHGANGHHIAEGVFKVGSPCAASGRGNRPATDRYPLVQGNIVRLRAVAGQRCSAFGILF